MIFDVMGVNRDGWGSRAAARRRASAAALSVRHKLVVSSVFLLLLGGLSATALTVFLARGWIEEGLREQAFGFARTVAVSMEDRPALVPSQVMDDEIQRILAVRPSVLQLDILALGAPQTRVVATSHPSRRLPFSRRETEQVRRGQAVSHLVDAGGDRYWEIMTPIRIRGEVAGAVAVKFSLLRADLLTSRIRTATLGLTLVLVVLGGTVMSLAVRVFVDRPVGRFMEAIRRVGAGDPAARVSLSARDEFGVLASHFNGMMARITEFSGELQSRVAEATAELDRRYREVERLNALLFQMQRTLSHADRLALAGRIMAEVAHEVGTPLHSVAGHLELLRRDLPPSVLSEDLLRRFGIMETQLARVTEIIAQLLDLTRRLPGAVSEVDLNCVVRDTVDLVRPGVAAAVLTLDVELAPDLPAVGGHASQLQQVVLNLVTNAMDATPAGGRLAVQTRVSRGTGQVEVEIRDTGEGIPAERRKQIFEPFFSTKPPGRGTGLGLFIAAQIVRDHQGRIEVESRPGHGSTFRIILPAAGNGS